MAALTEQPPNAVTAAATGVGGRGWMRSALIIVLLALLAGAAVLGLRNSSLLPATFLSGPSGRSGASNTSDPLASPIAEKASGMVDSVKNALDAIAERSPGIREGAQLINKLARQRSFLAGPSHPRSASPGRPHRASRSIPRRAPPAPAGSPADSLLSDLVAPLESVAPGQSPALVPASVVPPAGGGGGFFAPGPGPVFLGGGGPGGSVTPPPGPVTPPVVETPTPSSPVPEPSTWLTLIVGLAVVAGAMRRTTGQPRRGEVSALRVV